MHLQYLSFFVFSFCADCPDFVVVVDNEQHDKLVICYGLVLYKSYNSYISFLFSCQFQ